MKQPVVRRLIPAGDQLEFVELNSCPGGCVAGAGTLLPVDLATKVIGRYQNETDIVSPMDSRFGEMGKDMD